MESKYAHEHKASPEMQVFMFGWWLLEERCSGLVNVRQTADVVEARSSCTLAIG